MATPLPPNRAVFDLEIARPLPNNGKGTDWKSAPACGISTLVMWPVNGIHPYVGIMDHTRFPMMFVTENWLNERFAECDGLVSWNGLDFDMRVMAKQTEDIHETIKDRRHVDIMAIAAAIQAGATAPILKAGLKPGWSTKFPSIKGDWLTRGWRLDSVFKATCGSDQGKLVGFDGAEAPVKWQSGQYSGVITYCIGDVAMTRAIYLHAWNHGYIASPERGRVAIPREYL